MSEDREADSRLFDLTHKLLVTYRFLHPEENPRILTYGGIFDKALALGLERSIFYFTTAQGTPNSIVDANNKLRFIDSSTGISCPTLMDIWVLSHAAGITQPVPLRYNQESFRIGRGLAARWMKEEQVDEPFRYFVSKVIEKQRELEEGSEELPKVLGRGIR